MSQALPAAQSDNGGNRTMTTTDAQIEEFFREQDWQEKYHQRVGRLGERHTYCQACDISYMKCEAWRLDDPPDKCCDECSHYWEAAS